MQDLFETMTGKGQNGQKIQQSRETTCPLGVNSGASETIKPMCFFDFIHGFCTWGPWGAMFTSLEASSALCFCARFVARARGQGGDQTTFAGADGPRWTLTNKCRKWLCNRQRNM